MYRHRHSNPHLSKFHLIGRAIAALLPCGLYLCQVVQIPTWKGLLVSTLMAYLFCVHWIFKKWKNANVIGRRNKHSPSDRPLPLIKTLDDSKELILNNSKLDEQFDAWELLNDVRNMKVTRKNNRTRPHSRT